MEWFFLWVGLSVVVGIIASSRGRSGFAWGLMSIIFSPILMIILVLALPAPQRTESGEIISPKTHVRCPDCREIVRIDATKCKHCGCTLVPPGSTG